MTTRNDEHSQQRMIDELQGRIRTWERGAGKHSTSVRSTGCRVLDALLSGHARSPEVDRQTGVRQGSLVEWIGLNAVSGIVPDTGARHVASSAHWRLAPRRLQTGATDWDVCPIGPSGAGTVSLIAGRQVCPSGKLMVLIDVRHDLYPLSLSLLGFDLSRVVLIRPASEKDALWACEEALKCPGVGLVWANIERLTSTSYRRLQLAAEASSGIGFLVRSMTALHSPSWAETRLSVTPRPPTVRRTSLSVVSPTFATDKDVRRTTDSRPPKADRQPGFHLQVISSHGKPNHVTADIVLDRLRGTIHEHPPATHSLPVVSRVESATVQRRTAGA